MLHFGLVGYPVKHSLSPWIHHNLFEKTNINGEYVLYEINPQEFEEKITTLKEKLDGFNITLPYKQRIIPILDDLDVTAKESGAVNTAVKEGNRWVGYNTDGIGFVRSLTEVDPHLLEEKDLKVLIIGAGGAARGILHALTLKGIFNIDLANRTIKNARNLMEDFSTNTRIYSLAEVVENLSTYDLIIQTTSVGMIPKGDEQIIALPKLNKSTLVSDIVYQPLKTAFLTNASRSGAQIHYGHTMLLYQALYAYEKWTNTYPKVEDLEEKLKEKLKGS